MDGHDAFGISKALKPRHVKALEAVRRQDTVRGMYAHSRLNAYEGQQGGWKAISRGIAGSPRTPAKRAADRKYLREINSKWQQGRLF